VPSLQRIAEYTHGVVTPANLLDVVAIVGVGWAAPRLDTWPGIAVGAPSYVADVFDGIIARRTNTASWVGEIMDHVVGDKPKVLYGLLQIWRMRLADRPLVAAVATYNAANAVVTGYDWLRNAEPQISVTPRAKRAMFTTTVAVGLQVIAHKIAETHTRLGNGLSSSAAVLGYGGVVLLGVPTTRDYWRMARAGKKRRS
jgi:phosphatidylglycerophosphate synthase